MDFGAPMERTKQEMTATKQTHPMEPKFVLAAA